VKRDAVRGYIHHHFSSPSLFFRSVRFQVSGILIRISARANVSLLSFSPLLHMLLLIELILVKIGGEKSLSPCVLPHFFRNLHDGVS
jgi:hypothetical protein